MFGERRNDSWQRGDYRWSCHVAREAGRFEEGQKGRRKPSRGETDMSASAVLAPKVVSHEEWIAARKEFLRKEKEFTKLRDELTQQRHALPWERVEKQYVFEGPQGKQSLAELFDGKSQLVIYHFMFAPEWEAGCPSCSFWADNFNSNVVHLKHRDITIMAVSRAPYSKLATYQKRMGWSFKWVSSHSSDFNFDYHVSFTSEEVAKKQAEYNYVTHRVSGPELPGTSVFFKDSNGNVFHTYSTYERGIDLQNSAYNYMDLTPKGRDEDGRGQFWVRRHDEYSD
jgi:predicted dithiol-disulfide oxidoreductase (DUF899 family)